MSGQSEPILPMVRRSPTAPAFGSAAGLLHGEQDDILPWVPTMRFQVVRPSERSDSATIDSSPWAPDNCVAWASAPDGAETSGTTGRGHAALDGPDPLTPSKAPRPVRVPLYMFCLDLAFTAAFNVCAQCLRLSVSEDGWQTIPRFWATYLPIAWIWDHTNRFFN
eukprot:1314386-Prymnesium_polylepis.1